MKQRLFLVPLLSILLLLFACSDDDSTAAPGAPVASPAASTSATVTAQIKGQIVVDFSGAPSQRPQVTMSFAVSPGAKALEAIKAALGESNISTQDFGGDLGVFITGFYGVKAEGNHYWEFVINDKGADVGVSGYEVKDGDVLKFRYASF